MESYKPDSFHLISWEVDTTGRLLCDEMFRLSSMFGKNKFDEYIMPYRNICPFTSRKFQVITSSSGLYRYLRKKANGKVLRSKTEFIALEYFMEWLSTYSQKPIVLMCYEPFEFSPYVLLQALQRYNMLDKFKEMVYGFAHVYAFVKKKCKKSMSSLALRPLAKVLLNKSDVKYYDSLNRVKVVNEILLHLCDDDGLNPMELLEKELQPYLKKTDDVKRDLESRKQRVDLQISLKPIFTPYLKNPDIRHKSLILRSYLTRLNVTYDELKSLWEKGKEIFKDEIKTMLNQAAEDTKKELISILLHHFDCKFPKLEDELEKKLSIED